MREGWFLNHVYDPTRIGLAGLQLYLYLDTALLVFTCGAVPSRLHIIRQLARSLSLDHLPTWQSRMVMVIRSLLRFRWSHLLRQ